MTLFSAALASASLASRPVRILRIAGLYPGQLSRTTSQCPHADGFNASNSSFDTDPFFINFRGSAMTTSTPLRRTLPCKLTFWTISAASATCTLKKATASLRAPSRHLTVLPPNRNIAILIFGFQAMRRNI